MELRSLGWRDEQWEASGLWEELVMGWRWLDGKDGASDGGFSLHFHFWESCVSCLATPCPVRASHRHCTTQPSPSHLWEFSPMPMDHHLPSWSPHLLAAADHPRDEIPEPVLNHLFLEITPNFLTQIISFCFRGSSLEFLNATARIDDVPGQHTAVDSCFLGDFSSLSNQRRQRLSP